MIGQKTVVISGPKIRGVIEKELKIFLLIFILSLKKGFTQEKGLIDNDSIIAWNEHRKLMWEDFKGVRDSINFPIDEAATNYSIYLFPKTITVDEYKKINAVTFFYKKTSWTTNYASGLLAHEQIHFDIAELYTRKIRKSFLEMKNNDETDVFEYVKVAKKFDAQCLKYGQLYDQETEHGTLSLKQLEWEDRIAKELKELDMYKYTPTVEDIEN